VTWRDDLIPCALNGVPFGMLEASKTGGRRTQTHEFADVDEVYVEDSGQGPSRYQIRGFVVGDDYHVTLQKLEEQLDLGGDIELDHPHRGKIFGLRLEGEYTTDEGQGTLGRASISFTLVQNGLPAPMIFESRPGAVKLAAAKVYLAAEEELKLLTKLGQISALSNQIDGFTAGLDTLASAPGTIATTFRGVALSAMDAIQTLAGLFGREAHGYANPADTMVDSMHDLVDANSTPEALADKEFASAVPPGEEIAGGALAAKTDLDVLNAFIAATTVAALAEFATEIELPTADAAEEFADAIIEQIDAVLGAEIGDGPISENFYTELINFKAKVVAFMTAIADQLPKVSVVTIHGQASVVLVAYWEIGVGGDALGQLVENIIDANNLENPLTIPDGTELKVVLA
jgi:prophage DNA circulation protein